MTTPEADGYIELTFTDGRTMTHYFKDNRGHTGTSNPTGLVIRQEGGHLFYPWVQIRSMKVRYNSDEYVAFAQQKKWAEFAEEGSVFEPKLSDPQYIDRLQRRAAERRMNEQVRLYTQGSTGARMGLPRQSFEEIPRLSVVLDNGAELPEVPLPPDLSPDET